MSDKVPDAMTIRLFRERLEEKGSLSGLFERMLSHVDAAGFAVRRARGRVHRRGSEAEQPPGRERAGREQRDAAGRVRGEAPAEGCAGALDEEARPQPLRLQEPCRRHRQRELADSFALGNGRVRTRQPSVRGAAGSEQRQRGRPRRTPRTAPKGGGVPARVGLSQPHPSQGGSRQAAGRTAEGGEPQAFEASGKSGACLCPTGRASGAHGGEDRASEPSLQHEALHMAGGIGASDGSEKADGRHGTGRTQRRIDRIPALSRLPESAVDRGFLISHAHFFNRDQEIVRVSLSVIFEKAGSRGSHLASSGQRAVIR